MAEIKKNDTFEVKIEDMGHDGAGIGKVDGYALFVKDAVIGDLAEVKVMKAKKNYGYARLMRVAEPSPYRTEPKCPVARQCGGCQIQALSYEQQLLFKKRKVENNLKRIGGFENLRVEPVMGMEEPYRYRNKAQFPIGTDKEGNPVAGFYAGRTHDIIPCTDCLLGHPVNERILKIVLDYMKEYRIPAYDEKSGKGLIRHVLIRCGFATGEIMVCLIINGRKLPKQEKLVEELVKVEGMTSITCNVNEERSNVILGRELIPVWGQGFITDYIGDIAYQISPLSFYQVNPVQTRKLYETALDFAGLTGKETVWDLYCGIGTISLFLAQKAKRVYGVEIVPEAIEDARRNARLNGIENVEFFVGRSEEVLPEYYAAGNSEKVRGKRRERECTEECTEEYAKACRKDCQSAEMKESRYADVIVVDPPRKGCEESLLETIVQMRPERVVYVSCDSATLARDLKYLCQKGYEVKRVQPVDMFGMTVHVECVVALHRVDM